MPSLRSGWGLTATCILTCSFLPITRAAAGCEIQLRLIGLHSIASDTRVGGDAFGGISGLDYDSHSQLWYMVSDDRTNGSAARFFTASLTFDPMHVAAVVLRDSRHFHADDNLGDRVGVDAESIRFNRWRGELVVAGEGDDARKIGAWLSRFNLDGHWLGDIPLPRQLDASAPGDPRGPRPNKSFEGVTPAPAASGLEWWLSLEAPLFEDGPMPDPQRGSDVRIARVRLDGNTRPQYVYHTEPTRGERSDNGVSEILATGDETLLVLERSGTAQPDGHYRFHTRLYCADFSKATDVSSFNSLAGGTYRTARKSLVLDFDLLPGVTTDNLEGMSWGPRLENGRASLVFVTDNNLFPDVATQLVFFEVRSGHELKK